MDDFTQEDSEVPAFQFQNSNLSSRCKDVFGSLDALEQKHKEFEKSRAREDADSDRELISQSPFTEEDSSTTATFKRPSLSGRDYHGSTKGGRHSHENIDKSSYRQENTQTFRKPMPPNYVRGRNPGRGRYGRGRATPDYKLHPERWTEYSLEDVDISDSANKSAALDFLHERRKMREASQREESMDLDVSACSKGQITFKKPSKTKNSDTGENKNHSKEVPATKISSEEKMESDFVDNDDQDTEVDRNLDRARNTVDATSLKRKFEDIELEEGSETTEVQSIGFKSRKSLKRSFRSRKSPETDSND